MMVMITTENNKNSVPVGQSSIESPIPPVNNLDHIGSPIIADTKVE